MSTLTEAATAKRQETQAQATEYLLGVTKNKVKIFKNNECIGTITAIIKNGIYGALLTNQQDELVVIQRREVQYFDLNGTMKLNTSRTIKIPPNSKIYKFADGTLVVATYEGMVYAYQLLEKKQLLAGRDTFRKHPVKIEDGGGRRVKITFGDQRTIILPIPFSAN